MNRKLLAAVLTIVFIFSFVPITVRGSETINLPYNYYYYWEIEAGDLDMVSWNFKSTGNKIAVYLMSSEDYQKYQLWPSRFLLEGLGELLAGYSYKASGQFNPTYRDTWYFIFLNEGIIEGEATVTINVVNFPGIHFIIPAIVIFIIACIGVFLIIHFYPEKEKENVEAQIQTSPATTRVQQPILEDSGTSIGFCPTCGKEVKEKDMKFCASCGREF